MLNSARQIDDFAFVLSGLTRLQASALRTHTESTLRGNTPSEKYREAVANARANASGQQSASRVLNEGMLLEALGPKAGFRCINAAHLPLREMDRHELGHTSHSTCCLALTLQALLTQIGGIQRCCCPAPDLAKALSAAGGRE